LLRIERITEAPHTIENQGDKIATLEGRVSTLESKATFDTGPA